MLALIMAGGYLGSFGLAAWLAGRRIRLAYSISIIVLWNLFLLSGGNMMLEQWTEGGRFGITKGYLLIYGAPSVSWISLCLLSLIRKRRVRDYQQTGRRME
ncbi:hypothetical protein Q5741_04410 [Paenibacillus sp. JX-17]|uniref:Uncharacterized protein n=1 Tax=Paenibacillus lacisoli TaxID=3064525 RepID=A0ABT9CDH5_9BACL|nr:hypothetical protein [Paenibacillus sp. JX-17]MDO7905653.1 hypothetical protein [Paenibacillus sp. JX-17]